METAGMKLLDMTEEPGSGDDLNDETFGSGAVEDDWEATHFAVVGMEGDFPEDPLHHSDVTRRNPPEELLHHDDGIISVVASGSHSSSSRVSEDLEEVLPSMSQMNIKELWPSSPKQSSALDSIWSSPELPVADKSHGTPHMAPGSRVMTVEDLEKELISSPPHSSHPQPPHPHQEHNRPAPPPGPTPPPGMAPLPGLMQRPLLPHGRMPVPLHPHRPMMLGHWLPPRGPLPPPPISMLPPHLLALTRNPRPGPQGMPTHPSHLPPHHHPHPHPLPPPHHHNPPPPQHQQPRRSKRSEFLSDLKPDGSGFMTQKEKEWVVKIQLLQLQSPDPANDDYYYQHYMQKKLSEDARSDGSPHRHHPSSPILTLPQVTREERSYKPMEFKGTLGKLSVSSITAPRKTIEVPSSVQESEKVLASGGAKKKQVLSAVEKAYALLLQLEELERRALALPEEDRPQLQAQRDQLCTHLLLLLRVSSDTSQPLEKSSDQWFSLMMSYRKGRRALKRILPLLSDVQAQVVVLALLRNVTAAIKRDISDQVLPELVLSVRAVVAGMELAQVSSCMAALLEGATVRTAANEFGSAVLLSLVKRGQQKATAVQTLTDDQTRERWVELTRQLSSSLLPHSERLSSLKSSASLLQTLASLPHLQHLKTEQ